MAVAFECLIFSDILWVMLTGAAFRVTEFGSSGERNVWERMVGLLQRIVLENGRGGFCATSNVTRQI